MVLEAPIVHGLEGVDLAIDGPPGTVTGGSMEGNRRKNCWMQNLSTANQDSTSRRIPLVSRRTGHGRSRSSRLQLYQGPDRRRRARRCSVPKRCAKTTTRRAPSDWTRARRGSLRTSRGRGPPSDRLPVLDGNIRLVDDHRPMHCRLGLEQISQGGIPLVGSLT